MKTERKFRPRRVTCCIQKAALALLEEHGQPGFKRTSPTHKGPDLECPDCSSFFVFYGDSNAVNGEGLGISGVFTDTTCVSERDHQFTIFLSRCANEALGGCADTEYGECGDCTDPIETPELINCKPGEPGGHGATVLDEATVIWADREILETDLSEAVRCCLRECGVLARCSPATVRLGTVQTETAGGCTTVTLNLTVRW